MDAYCPVENFDPLPEDEPALFLKAEFETPRGERFKGYLVGDDTFYAFGLFVDGNEHVLNLNVPKLIEATERELAATRGESFRLFPLKYETSLAFAGHPRISGVLADPRLR